MPLRTIKASVAKTSVPRQVIARAVHIVMARNIVKGCLPRVNERKIDVDFEPGEIHLRLGGAELFGADLEALRKTFKAEGVTVRPELVVCMLGSKVLTWPSNKPKKPLRKKSKENR